MMTARLFVTLTLVLGAVALGELMPTDGRRLYGDLAQLVAGAGAAAVCALAARGRTGGQRRWRLLAAAGLSTWAVIRLWWVVLDFTDPGRGLTTAADLGFLVLPAGLFLGLL